MKSIISSIFLIIIVSTFMAFNVYAQDTPFPSEDQDTIRDKVKEKVENARSNPKAYIGSVTDKTQDSIQIKDQKGDILFVSVNPDEVKFAKSGASAPLKFNDVAIGDYVIAMGYRNGTAAAANPLAGGILNAKRIVVASEENIQRKILVGNITKIVNKDISVKDSNGQLYTYTFPRSWKGPEIKDLEVDDPVALVAVEDNGKYMVRTISKIVDENTSE